MIIKEFFVLKVYEIGTDKHHYEYSIPDIKTPGGTAYYVKNYSLGDLLVELCDYCRENKFKAQIFFNF